MMILKNVINWICCTQDCEYNGEITELCGVPIARCVPQIMRYVHHHDWLNMVQKMTRLAQFSPLSVSTRWVICPIILLLSYVYYLSITDVVCVSCEFYNLFLQICRLERQLHSCNCKYIISGVWIIKTFPCGEFFDCKKTSLIAIANLLINKYAYL